jgi:hypothetical protein
MCDRSMNGLHFHCHDGEIVDISYLAWPLAAAAGTLLISSHVQRILRVVFPIETPAMATGVLLALRFELVLGFSARLIPTGIPFAHRRPIIVTGILALFLDGDPRLLFLVSRRRLGLLRTRATSSTAVGDGRWAPPPRAVDLSSEATRIARPRLAERRRERPRPHPRRRRAKRRSRRLPRRRRREPVGPRGRDDVEALLGAQQRGGRGRRRDEAVRRHEARGSRGGRGRARLGRRDEEAEEAVGDGARRGRAAVLGGPGVAGHGARQARKA